MPEYCATSDRLFKQVLEQHLRRLAPDSHLASKIFVEVDVEGCGTWGGVIEPVTGGLILKLQDSSGLPWEMHLHGRIDLDSLRVISVI